MYRKRPKRSAYLLRISVMVSFALLFLFVLQLLTANWTVTLLLFAVFSSVIVFAPAVGRGLCGWVCPVGSRYKAKETNKPSKYAKAFCSYICPAGLLLSLFNKMSFLQLVRDGDKCGGAMCPLDYACIHNCPMGCDVLDKRFKDRNCIRCFRCVRICEEKALEAKWLWQ